MQPFLYVRGLKAVSHTVFGVSAGQKTYYDPQFGRSVPYSSGQQVKRSVLEVLLGNLGLAPAPVTFLSNLDAKGKLGEGEPWSACDPRYPDQLLGGWMKAQKGGKDGEAQSRTLKRRSPLSISALHALHPLLASVNKEDVTFDRSDRPDQHRVIVRDANGKELSPDQISTLLQGTDRSLLRKWIPENTRATGLFIYDIAIDLRTLFCVALSETEPEITAATRELLKGEGWQESENAFGRCLVCPAEQREKLIPALAQAVLEWRVLTNQSRTFSPMETLAVAITDNASVLSSAIRAKLVPESEGSDRPKARPIVERVAGAEVYITPGAAQYIFTEEERATALADAHAELVRRLSAFDYDHQAVPMRLI